jgi:hypothetical protein
MSGHAVALAAAKERQTRDYGITHESAHVYRVAGDSGPHRIVVWDNARRQLVDSDGCARYVDPRQEVTTDRTSVLITGEAAAICADTRLNTGQPGSGQVYGEGVLRDGDDVMLTYPDGGAALYAVKVNRYMGSTLIPARPALSDSYGHRVNAV